MKISDPNLTPAGSSGIGGTSGPAAAARAAATTSAAKTSPGDDVHLSELVRSLRSLAADSPERQTKIEALARTHASGAYRVDAHATAAAIVLDATRHTASQPNATQPNVTGS